jgi:hypothetical protein
MKRTGHETVDKAQRFFFFFSSPLFKPFRIFACNLSLKNNSIVLLTFLVSVVFVRSFFFFFFNIHNVL